MRPLQQRPLFGAVAILVAVALVLTAGFVAQRRAEERLAAALRHDTALYVLGLRGAAEKFEYLPFALSGHPVVSTLVATPSNTEATANANQYLQTLNERAGSSVLFVLDVNGTTLASSNWQRPDSFVGHSYASRPYFVDARAGRNGLFHGVGLTTSIPGLFFSSPIRINDQIMGVVVVKVEFELLKAAWSDARAPAVVFDQRGIAFLSSVPAWLYQSTRPLTDTDLAWLSATKQYGKHQVHTQLPWTSLGSYGDGNRLLAARIGDAERTFLATDVAVKELGWTLTVLADYEAVTKSRSQVFAVASALVLAITLVGLFSWNRELRREREFRKSMEESLHIGMRARSLDGRIIYVNAAFCDMVGYSRDELVDRLPPYPYWHPEDTDKHWANNEAVLNGQSATEGVETRIRHKTGLDVYTLVHTAPLRDADGRHLGWMSSVANVTEQRRIEKEIRDSQSRLQHASRLAHVGEIASMIAHELNQPLMALSGFAMAGSGIATEERNPTMKAIFDDISAQVQRAALIVKGVRDFVGRDSRALEPCDLADILATVLRLLSAEIRHRHVVVHTDIEPGLAEVNAERILIEQVIMNLLLNAMQAMQKTPAAQRKITISLNRSGEFQLTFRIADCGPGVDSEKAATLFRAFFTSKPDGLGLGLNICRTIIERHGGRIDFENLPSGGAAFYFSLPVDA